MLGRGIREGMRAAILKQYGKTPEVGEWDEPTAQDGQAAVEVLAAGMNPVDRLMATGSYPRGAPPVPSVVGREGIARLEDGTSTYFNSSIAPFGSFAERTLIDPERAFPLPEGLDPGLAVCFGIAGMAAWLALEWRAKLREGETVLVLGASGVVGQIGVQAARLLGAGRVVAAARHPESLERARELGADAVVKLDAEDDLPGALREAAGGDGPDVIIDPLWGDPAQAAIAAAGEGARFVQIGSSAAQEISLAAPAFRNKMLVLMGHTNFAAPPEVQRDAFTKMAAHGAKGELVVDVERVALDDAPDAWDRQADSPRRKLVIVP